MNLRHLHERLCRLRQLWQWGWPGLPAIYTECLRQLVEAGALHAAAVAPIWQIPPETQPIFSATYTQPLAPTLHRHPLQGCTLAVCAWIEREGKRLSRQQPAAEPAYHNRLHIADTLVALCSMIACHQQTASPDTRLSDHTIQLLMLTMSAHDLLHDGGMNRFSSDMEMRSFLHLEPLLVLHDIARNDQERIRDLILATDPVFVAKTHTTALALPEFNPENFHWQAVFIQEADITASSFPDLGTELTEHLAMEWAAIAPEKSALLRQPQGRLNFLRHGARFSSPASRKLGLQRLVQRQIFQLSHQDDPVPATPSTTH
jgi:hypothetical protein